MLELCIVCQTMCRCPEPFPSACFVIYLYMNFTARAANTLLSDPLYATQSIHYLCAAVLV